jgi:hypothetical protein
MFLGSVTRARPDGVFAGFGMVKAACNAAGPAPLCGCEVVEIASLEGCPAFGGGVLA